MKVNCHTEVLEFAYESQTERTSTILRVSVVYTL